MPAALPEVLCAGRKHVPVATAARCLGCDNASRPTFVRRGTYRVTNRNGAGIECRNSRRRERNRRRRNCRPTVARPRRRGLDAFIRPAFRLGGLIYVKQDCGLICAGSTASRMLRACDA
jgi:hypothetical protein